MAIRLPFKRGDTFELDVEVTDVNGDPQPLTDWEIASQVRDKDGVLVADLVVVEVTPLTGIYKLVKSDTTDWPVELLSCDIQYTTDAGQIVSTETFEIQCLVDITQ